jgi:2',3'-cyclic-nucleotide 2'-phosphodiesterase (5'-nucleotidase family)
VLGGLARRVAFIDRTRTEGDKIIVVDTGCFYPDARSLEPARAKAKAELIGRIYRRMGVTAVNVSDLELQQGVAFLKGEITKGLPLTSANIIDNNAKLVFPNYKIKKVDRIRIGFFGLTRQSLDENLAEREGVAVKDPLVAAKDTVQRLRKKADMVVLLSDLGQELDRKIAAEVSDIDFIFDSRDVSYGYSQKLDNAYLLTSSKDGKNIGRLRMLIDNPSKPFTEDSADRIKQQIRDIDANIQSFSKNASNDENERMIRHLRQQRTQLQQRLSYGSNPRGNQFSWSSIPLEKDIAEDRAIAEWIRKAGFDRD